jgi:hypothetical protein
MHKSWETDRARFFLLQYKMSGSEKGGHKEGSKMVPDGPRGQVSVYLDYTVMLRHG